jgi:CDP-diglyceride synthetase
MLHVTLIALHALSALVAFTAGCVAIRRRALFPAYFWALVATLLFVVLAVATDWPRLDTPARAAFTALLGLGAVVGWQAIAAWRALATDLPPASGVSGRYLNHLGFTLVALFDAFVIILAIDLGAGTPVAVVVGVLGAAGGNLALRVLKSRLAPHPDQP